MMRIPSGAISASTSASIRLASARRITTAGAAAAADWEGKEDAGNARRVAPTNSEGSETHERESRAPVSPATSSAESISMSSSSRLAAVGRGSGRRGRRLPRSTFRKTIEMFVSIWLVNHQIRRAQTKSEAPSSQRGPSVYFRRAEAFVGTSWAKLRLHSVLRRPPVGVNTSTWAYISLVKPRTNETQKHCAVHIYELHFSWGA